MTIAQQHTLLTIELRYAVYQDRSTEFTAETVQDNNSVEAAPAAVGKITAERSPCPYPQIQLRRSSWQAHRVHATKPSLGGGGYIRGLFAITL